MKNEVESRLRFLIDFGFQNYPKFDQKSTKIRLKIDQKRILQTNVPSETFQEPKIEDLPSEI